jgi:hypothetical protein
LTPLAVRLPPVCSSTVLLFPIASVVPALAAPPAICAVPPFATFVWDVPEPGTPLSQFVPVNHELVAPVQLVSAADADETGGRAAAEPRMVVHKSPDRTEPAKSARLAHPHAEPAIAAPILLFAMHRRHLRDSFALPGS